MAVLYLIRGSFKFIPVAAAISIEVTNTSFTFDKRVDYI
jgi:hypothetical protein